MLEQEQIGLSGWRPMVVLAAELHTVPVERFELFALSSTLSSVTPATARPR